MQPDQSSPSRRRWLPLFLVLSIVTVLFTFIYILPGAVADYHEPPPPPPDDPVQADSIQLFHAHLSGAQERPAVHTAASGQAVLALDGNTLHYRVLVKDIDNITMAHIHLGARGVNGGIVHWLYDANGVMGPGGDFDAHNPISGSLTLSSENVDDLLAEDYYINVHTPSYPAGEIRGQIEPFTPPTKFNALLTGAEEVPPVDTDAVGLARLELTGSITLTYQVDVSDIVSITMAHIHRGPRGVNGPPVHWLYDAAGVNGPGGDFDPDNPISGTLTLDAADLVDLLTGFSYVNVHTPDNPAGEIRGQISGAKTFHTTLSGDEEVPPVNTDASGHAVLALSADASALYYRVFVSDIISITAAHIHRGAVGVAGPIVHDLYDGTGDFDPDNPISGSVPLTTDDVFDLIGGNYYINVHTVANPGGEIRGQIGPHTPPEHLMAFLSGANEVPAVDTDASGVTEFTLYNDMNTLNYRLRVNNIANITQAHIHYGPRGVNGGVTHWLYDPSGAQAPGGLFDADNPVGNGVLLNAEHMVDLLTEYLYVNVHTTANPAGEIRGQIIEPRRLWMPIVTKD